MILLESPECQKSDKRCGGLLRGSTGEFRSPDIDHDGHYDANTFCRWTFDVTIDGEIQIQFTHFDISDHQLMLDESTICEGCCFDYVEVRINEYFVELIHRRLNKNAPL